MGDDYAKVDGREIVSSGATHENQEPPPCGGGS